MFCPVCGTLNEDTVPFCGGCGGKLIPDQPVYQQPVYQQPVYQPVYQQPVYQQPIYQPRPLPVYHWVQMPAPSPLPGKGLGMAGMILGIVSLLFFSMVGAASVCALLAIIFSAIAMVKAKKENRSNGQAAGGLACGILGLVVSLLFLMLVTMIASSPLDAGMEYSQWM